MPEPGKEQEGHSPVPDVCEPRAKRRVGDARGDLLAVAEGQPLPQSWQPLCRGEKVAQAEIVEQWKAARVVVLVEESRHAPHLVEYLGYRGLARERLSERTFCAVNGVEIEIEIIGDHAISEPREIRRIVESELAEDGKDDAEAFERLIAGIEIEPAPAEPGHVSARLMVLLEEQNALPRAGEVVGADEPRDACADDRYVVLVAHVQPPSPAGMPLSGSSVPGCGPVNLRPYCCGCCWFGSGRSSISTSEPSGRMV